MKQGHIYLIKLQNLDIEHEILVHCRTVDPHTYRTEVPLYSWTYRTEVLAVKAPKMFISPFFINLSTHNGDDRRVIQGAVEILKEELPLYLNWESLGGRLLDFLKDES